jgi:hypothetical protein
VGPIELAWAYRVALLEAGVKKGGNNLGEVDVMCGNLM